MSARSTRRDAGAASTASARIVHLGDRFVVFDKPPRLSLATPRRAPDAAGERLRAALLPEESALLVGREILLVHRLDEPTSGLVVAALDREEHRRLVAEFAGRRVMKLYLALVWGRPRPRQAVFDAPLGPDRADRRRMRVDASGKPARTRYIVLAVAPHISLLALWPETGRTHQLRVHLAAPGYPIVGDDLYGGPREHAIRDPRLRATLTSGRALLHAFRLEIPALSPSRFEAQLPPDFAAVVAGAGLALAAAGDLWQAPSEVVSSRRRTDPPHDPPHLPS